MVIAGVHGFPDLDSAHYRVGSTFAGLSLPLDLSIWQMPGCFLYQDRAVTFGLATNASGVAPFTMYVPNSPFLLGYTCFQQGLAVDPAGTPLGLILSNATCAVVGAR